VRIRGDERFVRDGSDLVTVLDVPAPLAALGDTFTVETLDGEEEIDIAAGTQPGHVITLKGKGLPSLRGRRTGDLRVVVNVVIPRRLNREQKDLLRKFADTLDGGHVDASDESVLGKLRRVLGSRA
jgi:molecular chaperone DnaJ